MAIQVKRRWHPELGAGLPRRDRRGCDYDAYVPDPLVGRSISLGGEAAADAADAESAITGLNLEARALGDDPSDVTAVEVLGNLNAMAWAVDTVAGAQEITLYHIREIHRRLLEGTRLAMEGGKLREGQNW